ncbi:sugar transporter [Phlyctochytrium arcticum]|nr:sugar transporter [Phlyctochytrium arcticum]
MGNMYNYMVSFGAAMGGLLFGYEIGVIGQVLEMDTFGRYFDYLKFDAVENKYVSNGFKAERTGNITMFFLLGCLGGAIIVSWMADFLGRKRSILVGGILFCIGVVLQFIANTLGLLYGGRVVSGLGIGILSMVVPLFIGETAPTHLRGRMIAIQQLMITIGILIASIVNAIIIKTTETRGDELEWRLALAMQMVPGVSVVFINIFMPYSPRWLANRDRDTEALKTLARLRGVDINDTAVQAEYREIKESIELERQVGNGSWSELLKKGIINRVVFVFILQMFQQWTGINFILYYAPDLIQRMGFNKEQATIPFNIANNFINVIGTFPGMYLVERSGRRKLLIWGGLGMGISQFIACLAVGLSKSTPAWSWVAIFAVYGFILNFSSTWGPVVWVYQSEIFGLRVRAKGTGVGTMSNWGFNAVIAKLGPIMSDKIDFYSYLVFGTIGIAMATFTWAFIPETMGKSLEDMDELFGAEGARHSSHTKGLEAGNGHTGDVELVKGKQ